MLGPDFCDVLNLMLIIQFPSFCFEIIGPNRHAVYGVSFFEENWYEIAQNAQLGFIGGDNFRLYNVCFCVRITYTKHMMKMVI